MIDWDPVALYEAAQRAESTMSGYYNDNVRIDTRSGPVLVRIPVPRADQMDLRVWDERDVLRAVSQHLDHVLRLLHASSDPPFQIHEFVTGRQLNEVAPRGTRVPPNVIPDVVDLFSQLATIQRDELPPLPADWPDDGKSADFGRMLSSSTQRDFGALAHQPERGRGRFHHHRLGRRLDTRTTAEVARWARVARMSAPRLVTLRGTDISRDAVSATSAGTCRPSR